MQMTYEETLDFMYSQLPMYQRQGKAAFKKDLTNILALTDALGNPETKFKSIHIGGTNGKGTTAHIIAAGLQAQGYKVGMYTSPHYLDFRERIKINGNFISEEKVIDFVEKNKLIFEQIKPSFFEMTVAMAFSHFAQQEVDVAIIEVGLGGRLDSTNIITPLLSIITNISYDHQAMLGDTLELIAGEKAGIIKSDIPVIIGESQSEVTATFAEKAKNQNTKISWADIKSQLKISKNKLSFQVEDKLWIEDIKTDLKSPIQQKNLLTGLYSLYQLQTHFKLNPEQVADGIKHMYEMTYYIGRYQILNKNPKVIADSAHNVAGVTALLESISSFDYKKLHIVIGMVNDKDISKVLRLLPSDATYYFAKANIPRGLDKKKLQAIALESKLIGKTYASVKEAYETSISEARQTDLILVLGSIFVVAEVLS